MSSWNIEEKVQFVQSPKSRLSLGLEMSTVIDCSFSDALACIIEQFSDSSEEQYTRVKFAMLENVVL